MPNSRWVSAAEIIRGGGSTQRVISSAFKTLTFTTETALKKPFTPQKGTWLDGRHLSRQLSKITRSS